MLENTTEDIETRIEKLKTEHRDLDDVLKRLSEDLNVDELQIRRLKKRKLQLKDTITILESQSLAGVSAGK
ncbi:MAG: YdcH family protein [Acidiferrobacterales bacterium]|nr:YdcH family protein [Acidiferrobacterales bacterium]